MTDSLDRAVEAAARALSDKAAAESHTDPDYFWGVYSYGYTEMAKAAMTAALPHLGVDREALEAAAVEIENGHTWITAVAASRIIRKHIHLIETNQESAK